MKDANTGLTKALPNAAANNNTNSIDLNVETAGGVSNKWRLGYIEVDIPALSDHTNTSVTNLITLQHSAEAAANFANTNPLVQVQLVGVAGNGSVATVARVPLPPDVKRYVRFNQTVPTNGGTGSNATITYDLVT
jgi:hypothetical protein